MRKKIEKINENKKRVVHLLDKKTKHKKKKKSKNKRKRKKGICQKAGESLNIQTVKKHLSKTEKFIREEYYSPATGTIRIIHPEKKCHYVYKLTDVKTGEFYFGVRSCNGDPKKDKYMGSYIVWKPKNPLVKKILKEFKTRKEACKFESHVINGSINNDKNMNFDIPFRSGQKYEKFKRDKINRYLNKLS